MRTKDVKKRQAIRDAVVEDVVQSGLAGASIARIAKRASVSQGTIYLYFENKDELLQQVFLEIKHEIHDCLMTAASTGASSKDAIRAMWFALFDHVAARPNDFAFAEYVSAARLLDDVRQPQVDAMAKEMSQIISDAVVDGTLRHAPIPSITALLTGPAMQLARSMVMRGAQVDAILLETTFDAIWRGIADA